MYVHMLLVQVLPFHSSPLPPPPSKLLLLPSLPHSCCPSDVTVDTLQLDSIVLNNSFESQVLKDYLSSKGKGVEEFLAECMDRLQEGTFSVHGELIHGVCVVCVCVVCVLLLSLCVVCVVLRGPRALVECPLQPQITWGDR